MTGPVGARGVQAGGSDLAVQLEERPRHFTTHRGVPVELVDEGTGEPVDRDRAPPHGSRGHCADPHVESDTIQPATVGLDHVSRGRVQVELGDHQPGARAELCPGAQEVQFVRRQLGGGVGDEQHHVGEWGRAHRRLRLPRSEPPLPGVSTSVMPCSRNGLGTRASTCCTPRRWPTFPRSLVHAARALDAIHSRSGGRPRAREHHDRRRVLAGADAGRRRGGQIVVSAHTGHPTSAFTDERSAAMTDPRTGRRRARTAAGRDGIRRDRPGAVRIRIAHAVPPSSTRRHLDRRGRASQPNQ